MNEKDLTFVVQGPIAYMKQENLTLNLISSIKKFFPNSKILLSTWDNPNLHEIPFLDYLVVNLDPGAEIFLDNPVTFNNVNRQIVSTYEGLKRVKTKFAVKVRSDLIFTNNRILNSLRNIDFAGRNTEYSVLRNHIVVSNQTSINPKRGQVLPFHICDWIWAGRVDDLLDVWKIPLMPDNEFRFFAEEYVSKKFNSSYMS